MSDEKKNCLCKATIILLVINTLLLGAIFCKLYCFPCKKGACNWSKKGFGINCPLSQKGSGSAPEMQMKGSGTQQ